MINAFLQLGSLTVNTIGNIVEEETLAKCACYYLSSLIFVSITRLILFTFVFQIESPIWVVEKYGKKINKQDEYYTKENDSQDKSLDNR